MGMGERISPFTVLPTAPGTFTGRVGDLPAVADYNGDGRAGPALFRPSTGAWYISGLGTTYVYGAAGDLPIVADYSGDGLPDIAVYRASNNTWYIGGMGSFV